MSLPHKSTQFYHLPLVGDAYQVGRMQGEMARDLPGYRAFIGSGRGALDAQMFAGVQQAFDRYLPALNAEIEGLADALGLAPQEVMYYAPTYLRAPGCSHLAVLPPATRDGHVWVARTYDYSDAEDDHRLCTTHIDGKYRHIGFSVMLFGRCDGLNEHGLSVTMSAGGPPLRSPVQTGFQFWAAVRAVLETCRNVEEGLALIGEMPMSGNVILLLADRGGQAALVEVYGSHKAIRRARAGDPQPYLTAANHYTLPEMLAHQTGGIMPNSPARAGAMGATLAQGPVGETELAALAQTGYPQGLSCHFYNQYFGTLHALLFDLTSGQARVCFGSPAANPWHTFDLTPPDAPAVYPAVLPQSQAEPEFFR